MTEPEPVGRRVVAIAASAGGIEAIGVVLAGLAPPLGCPVLIVQHLYPRHPSHLAEVLGRTSRLPVATVEGGERLEPDRVWVAPPDRHLLVGADGCLELSRSALVHFVRPSADLLFESVAGAYGAGTIAVVLSGSGQDGAMGVRAVHRVGGLVLVEDPQVASFPGMPESAVSTGAVDEVLALAEIPGRLNELLAAGATTRERR